MHVYRWLLGGNRHNLCATINKNYGSTVKTETSMPSVVPKMLIYVTVREGSNNALCYVLELIALQHICMFLASEFIL